MIRDIRQIEESTIWEDTGRAINESKNKQTSGLNIQKKLIVLGDRSSGKTSFIKILKNDFDPDTKPNSLIQFTTFKSGKEKELVHCYQIGNKQLGDFLTTVLLSSKISQSQAIITICIDLTKGKKVLSTAIGYINLLKQIYQKVKTENPSKIKQFEQQQFYKTICKIKRQHEDSQIIQIFSIKTIIIGCKFDQFQKFDSNYKKWTIRALRYIAHTTGSDFYTSSNKNNQMNLNLRNIFGKIFDGANTSQIKLEQKFVSSKDIVKPIYINFGDDKIKQMNLPSSSGLSNLELLEKELEEIPDQKTANQQSINKISQGNRQQYRKIKLDDLLQTRRKDLAKLQKNLINFQKNKP